MIYRGIHVLFCLHLFSARSHCNFDSSICNVFVFVRFGIVPGLSLSMTQPVTLCRIKFEIDSESMMNQDVGQWKSSYPRISPSKFVLCFPPLGNEGGAAAAAVVKKEHRGQRKADKIVVENYTNTALPQEECRGILPPSSREVTPVQEVAPQPVSPADGEEICFVSGNPFVEVTKGVIHLFKKK